MAELYWKVELEGKVKFIPVNGKTTEGDYSSIILKFNNCGCEQCRGSSRTDIRESETNTINSPEKYVVLTEEMVRQGVSDNGGYSKGQRELLGLKPPWPPAEAPIETSFGTKIPAVQFQKFLELKNKHLKGKNNKITKSKQESSGKDLSNLLPSYYPKNAPTVFSTDSRRNQVVRQKKFDPEWDEPGGPRLQRTKEKCPNCFSDNVRASGTGSAECNDCGYFIH